MYALFFTRFPFAVAEWAGSSGLIGSAVCSADSTGFQYRTAVRRKMLALLLVMCFVASVFAVTVYAQVQRVVNAAAVKAETAMASVFQVFIQFTSTNIGNSERYRSWLKQKGNTL